MRITIRSRFDINKHEFEPAVLQPICKVYSVDDLTGLETWETNFKVVMEGTA